MGANASSPETLLNQYSFDKKSPGSNNSILRHKKNGQILLLKQISTTSQSDLNTLLQRSYKRKGLVHEHYLTLQEVFQKAEGSFCSTLYKANLLYQYGNHTLQHQIQTRIDQNRQFQQKQLWSIICSTVLALSFLIKQHIEYQTISPSDIFLNSEGIVKIPDPDLASETFNGGFPIKSINYLSPESLQGRHNPGKSCIFSLGICMLQTMLMESMAICYAYQDCKLDQKQLSGKIEQMKLRGYNVSLVGIVENMLAIDPKRRPSIIELEQKLFTILRQDQSSQLQPLTPLSSGIVDQKLGDQNLDNDINSQKLLPMAPEKDEWVSLVVQTFQEIDYENPDDAQEQSEGILTDRSNRILPNNINQGQKYEHQANKYQHQTKSKLNSENINPYPSNKKPNEDIFTDPQLLQMLRKDIQEINMKKSKYLNYSSSNDISTKIQNPSVQYESNHKRQPSKHQNRKVLESFGQQTELKYVNENYARGRYEGQKKGNLRQGYGTFFYKQGGRYTGAWKNNKMHGKGTLYYANNEIAYQGDWIEDHLWGYGTLYNQDPQPLRGGYSYRSFDQVDEYWVKYEGQFVDDNKCGNGKLFLSNDQIFEGSFENDAVHGVGTFITKDRKHIKGEWVQNRLVKEIK